MNNGNEFLDFILDPNTIDFITRRSERLDVIMRRFPGIRLAETLYGRFVVGYLPRNLVDTFVRELGAGVLRTAPVVLGLMDKANLESAGITQVQEQPFLDLRGRGTIVGIVDTGIDYTNPSFIYEDGTSKILYIFDQTINDNIPEGFFEGTEYTNEQINQALQAPDPYEIVPHRDTVGHGTFLASVAAGREIGTNIGAAPDAELIVVKLRKARSYYLEKYLIPPEQENAFESTSVMIGIEYILRKATELGRPVSVCIGLGTNLGGHDGFSVFEEYLSSISNLRGLCLTAAAGNESRARHHTQGVLENTGDVQSIDIRMGENAGNVLITIINSASDRISVSIRSPTGETIGRVPAKPGSTLQSRLVLERATVIVEYFFPLEGSGGQETTVKILNATPGIWTINVFGDIVLNGTYHAWLPITGFVSPNVEFLTPTPNYTIVVPATAVGVITCGAYNSLNNSLFSDSSWGPTRLPEMSPDLTAPGVNVTGAVPFPAETGVMSGTSVAAAITAGAGALMLQWGIVEGNDLTIGTYQIKAFLIRGCSRSDNVIYPNNQWGYGRLNLIQSFNLMREF
ncbi:MAG: S8 family peptidase [Clostridiales bacterium]|nr:S8 family peptidase [Clostridiales bacterium]